MAETTSKAPVKKATAKSAKDASEAKAPKAPKAPSVASSDKPAATKAKSATTPSRASKAADAAPIALLVVPKPVVKANGKTMVISDEQRYRMIAEAAYYRAESNHFKSDPVRDWIEAESDIAALLGGSSN